MGYYANGGGTIKLKEALPTEFELPEKFNNIWDREVNIDKDGKTIWVSFNEKYYEEWFEDLFKLFEGNTESGCIELTGEDGCVWRLKYLDGEWHEENGRVIYDSDVVTNFNSEQKKELVGQLIDCVEDILSDGKPSESYIEGALYDKLSSRITDTLVNWRIL